MNLLLSLLDFFLRLSCELRCLWLVLHVFQLSLRPHFSVVLIAQLGGIINQTEAIRALSSELGAQPVEHNSFWIFDLLHFSDFLPELLLGHVGQSWVHNLDHLGLERT